MKPDRLVYMLLMALFMALPLAANADSFSTIATQARTKYAAAQEALQRGVAALVARKGPQFREIASIENDLQQAYIERADLRFRYLLAHDPHRIILNEGVSRFANFDWTAVDTLVLSKHDPAYARLEEKILALEKKNDRYPDWSKYRTWFRGTLTKSGEYQALLDDWKTRRRAVAELLSQYRP